MRILAIIITYFPDRKLLEDNVSALRDHIGTILIWENTPSKDKGNYRLAPDEKIVYCGGKGNVGIPQALNYAWHYAIDNGYDYVLTMDQDSVWSDFNSFLDKTVYSKSNDGNTIWGPNIYKSTSSGYEKRRSINTSGMLVSTKILNKVNGWPETFKIDCVDLDFCFNARKYGITILKVNTAYMEHNLGEGKRVFSLKTFKHKNIIVHSPQRTYGIVKNGIIMRKKYSSFPINEYLIGNVWKRLISILLYENHKIRQIAAIVKGLRDGLKTKTPHILS